MFTKYPGAGSSRRLHVNAAKISQKIGRSVEERIKAHAANLFPIRKTQNPAVSEQMDEIGLLVSPAKLMQTLKNNKTLKQK